MRAALQLLDRGDARAPSPAVGSAGRPPNGNTDYVHKSVLKSGLLKKASGSKLSHGGWKPKYVEIRHGDFIYEDDVTGWGEIGRKKTIPLIADRCRCRQVKTKSDPTVFELTEYGGIRRLWRANSMEERDGWIHAINAAVVGSAGDFEGDDAGVVFSPSADAFSPRHTSSKSGAYSGSASRKAAQSERALLTPYSEGIDIFVSTRDRVYRSSSDTEYRALLDSFKRLRTPFIVPVAFAKNFGKRPELRRQSSNIISNQTSQVWKDMCRDVIVINGVRVTGIESIICGLTRTLVDCAEHIRVMQVQRQQMESAVFGRASDNDVIKKGISFRDSVLGLTGMGDSSLGLMFYDNGQPLFDLNEGQILACAKEILYSCNRTHSGGDTYDSVNSMICHDKFAVLTPFDTEAEPMEIRIDVIQRESSRVVVHNAWLDKTVAPGCGVMGVRGSGPAAADSDPPLKGSAAILSPFRRMNSNRKLRRKNQRNSDPGIASPFIGHTPPGEGGRGGQCDDAGDEATPTAGTRSHKGGPAVHKRTETNSTASTMTTTPRQPFFQREMNDYDENTSDDEFHPNSSKKGGGEWHNPASSAVHDFSQPLGITERNLSPNLPPPTLTNVNRDRWGNSLSSFVDESSQSQGSSNGGHTSVSSSDNSGAIKSRVKAIFFGESKKKLESNENSEEDSKPARDTVTTSASASSGSVPPLPLHSIHLDLNNIINRSGKSGLIASATAASASASGGATGEASITPRKVVNVEDLSSCGEEEVAEAANEEFTDSPAAMGKHTRFIKHSAQAADVTDRPMCIRIEVNLTIRQLFVCISLGLLFVY
jgi:hypothetical protein